MSYLSLLTRDFDFCLPKTLIAKYPISPRDHSKLLCTDYKCVIDELQFFDLPQKLRATDILVFNNAKVIPSQLTCTILNDDGMISIDNVKVNLTKKINDSSWQLVGKYGKKLKKGSILHFKKNPNNTELLHKANNSQLTNNVDLIGEITDRDGMFAEVKFNVKGDLLINKFYELGIIPLPPYLERPTEYLDNINYQTIYAEKIGAVASPTAGLHFTKQMLEKISLLGIKCLSLTLHVGGGTFLPIKCDNISNHKMHTESFEIDKKIIDSLIDAKLKGYRIICVGTTTLRVLESISDIILSQCSKHFIPHKDKNSTPPFINSLRYVNGVYFGETNIFIMPNYKFKIADAIITNFHLPKSTLFVLICAILGKSNAHKIYAHAINNKYRFFSYGDACFFEITNR